TSISTSISTSTSIPTPLPHPLPAPGEPPPSAPSERDDPLDLLWSHRLHFARGGAPVVTIRLMEGQGQVIFRSRARAKLQVRGGGTIELAAGEQFRIRATDALPAVFAHHPLLAEAVQADHARLASARRLWEERGVTVEQRQVGGVYGIAGRVVDNRRIVVLAAGDGSEGFAHEFAEQALELYGSRTGTFSEVLRRPSGRLEVLDAAGSRLASADALASLEVEGGAGFSLAAVEHDVGHAAHGFEDRAYRGRLHVTLDASGRLAAVLELPLEELLRGLVPSEIPAGSPREALRAQAVTARSNVLAQLGTRHLGDPYALCSEVHCQAYRGETAQAAATDQAVRDTAGEALFGRADRTLVDAVYSALCGGHGEDNEAVWPTLPDPNLRGRPDLPPEASAAWEGGLRDEARLERFLEAAPNAWCARARGVRKDRYRWERRFAPAELDRLAVPLAVGHVRSLEVTGRGASGRARSLVVTGDAGRGTVEGELRIRQLLGNLPSAMFVVGRDGEATVLRGGGWGHGAGMCQWGAIGRAEAGQSYREILRAYYAGAEVAKVY
ncbi:MAG TPA: SpoIID/LytB domain-containing protein, partial [Anaeromyxobacteraceae bacterium]|nr:SpoIID/LytB domain-containing protein [Anaeromyxobacteraceae bacterium]